MAILYIIISTLFFIGIYLVITQTIQRKGNFGINLKTQTCTNCQETLSKIRMPEGLREILWGGWTCTKCGKKFDKWGKEI